MDLSLQHGGRTSSHSDSQRNVPQFFLELGEVLRHKKKHAQDTDHWLPGWPNFDHCLPFRRPKFLGQNFRVIKGVVVLLLGRIPKLHCS